MILRIPVLEQSTSYIITNAVEFVPTGRFIPIKRWLWNKLHAWGCLQAYRKPETTYSVRTVDTDQLLKALSLQRGQLFRLYNREASSIYVGLSTWRDFLNDPEVRDCLVFPVNWKLSSEQGDRLLGLTVHVVPYFEGVLVV